MKRGLMIAALAGAGVYWASRQRGGINGTWGRLRQGARDIAAGQDPLAVGRRFLAGTDEEPAGYYTEEAETLSELGPPQSPYRDYVSS